MFERDAVQCYMYGSAEGQNVVRDIDAYFDSGFEDSWFADPLVQEMIQNVDKSQVIGPHLIESPVLGPIAPSELSGGVKALICMLCEDEEAYIQDATNCGDNCAKWIQRISQKKDLTVRLGYIMEFSDDEYFQMEILNTGEIVSCRHDYIDACIEAGL